MASWREDGKQIDLIENSRNSQFHELFNVQQGGNMAKRPEGQPKAQAKRQVSRYYPLQIAVQTNELLKAKFKVALAMMDARSNLCLLDQKNLTGQAMHNVLMLWFVRKIEEGKAKWLEKEFEGVMEELKVITAKEMIDRGRWFDPDYAPDGVSVPKEWLNGKPESDD